MLAEEADHLPPRIRPLRVGVGAGEAAARPCVTGFVHNPHFQHRLTLAVEVARPAVAYKSALAKYFGGEAPDYVSFEYYIASRILVEALKRAGPQLDSEKLVETLESIRDFDLGLGTAINFNKSEHQGSHKVWGTQLNEAGNYEPVELQ